MSRDSKRGLVWRVISAARRNEVAVERFDRRAAEALGVNRTDARCLDVLDNEGAMTAGRLAERLGLTTAAVTAVIDRLEAKGYVKRVRDEQDRRRVNVEVTPLLRERTAAIWGPLGEEGTEALMRYSRHQLETLLAFFEASREINERHYERIKDLSFD